MWKTATTGVVTLALVTAGLVQQRSAVAAATTAVATEPRARAAAPAVTPAPETIPQPPALDAAPEIEAIVIPAPAAPRPVDALAPLRTMLEQVRRQRAAAEAALATLEGSIAALAPTAVPPTAAAAVAAEDVAAAQAAVVRAERVYADAVARERRAAQLIAFGTPATQELEQAQLAVRDAAQQVAVLRHEAQTLDALAAAATLRDNAAGVRAALQQQREAAVNELTALRNRQAALEEALNAVGTARD